MILFAYMRHSSSIRVDPRDKILQHLEANPPAFFWMELRGKQVSPLN